MGYFHATKLVKLAFIKEISWNTCSVYKGFCDKFSTQKCISFRGLHHQGTLPPGPPPGGPAPLDPRGCFAPPNDLLWCCPWVLLSSCKQSKFFMIKFLNLHKTLLIAEIATIIIAYRILVRWSPVFRVSWNCFNGRILILYGGCRWIPYRLNIIYSKLKKNRHQLFRYLCYLLQRYLLVNWCFHPLSGFYICKFYISKL